MWDTHGSWDEPQVPRGYYPGVEADGAYRAESDKGAPLAGQHLYRCTTFILKLFVSHSQHMRYSTALNTLGRILYKHMVSHSQHRRYPTALNPLDRILYKHMVRNQYKKHIAYFLNFK